MSKHDKILPLILFAIITLILIPFINIELFNEDYLVLHWCNPQTFSDCFGDFHQRITGGPYWRPVVWSSYFVTKYFWRMNGIPYHLTNILVYSSIISMLFVLYRKIGITANYAFWGLAVFALLPGRELNFAWVPGRTDLFASFFLLLSTYFYLKSLDKRLWAVPSILAFILATLSKEIAFAGAAIPILLLPLKQNDENLRKYAFFSSLIALFAVAIVLAYRAIVIGGTPFETSNFDSISLIWIVANFFIYLPLSVLNADQLEMLYLELTKLNFRVLIPIFLIILYLSRNIFVLLKTRTPNRNIFLFGLLWFLVFIVPALPQLMQWYGFIAYFGLFASFLVVLDDKKFEKAKFAIALMLVISLSLYNYSRAELWSDVAHITNYALTDLAHKIPADADTIYIIAAPDKINRINSMKIGLQEAISTHLNRKIEVLSPIRCEITKKSQLSIDRFENSGLIKINDGYFKMQGTRSSYFGNNEKLEYEDAFAKFSIKNDKSLNSKLEFTLKTYMTTVFIFNGERFINWKN